MRPIAVFCFSPAERPAYFANWLDVNRLPWRLYQLDAGESVPKNSRDFAGIGLMGGQVSANDPLVWRSSLLRFLREALDYDVPVIGHCLGSQLLAKALGARIERANVAEIGWYEVEVCDDVSDEWFGRRPRFTPFQWHYEQFALPPGARRVLTNTFNADQAFTIDNRHIGLQCHIEVDRAQIEIWCRTCAGLLPARSTPSRQSSDDILRSIDARISALRPITDAIYMRWSQGLRF
jgi:GMP synthase-like glutamine amidotransferase